MDIFNGKNPGPENIQNFLCAENRLGYIIHVRINILFLDKNMHYEYSLEAPQGGSSNEYQICFLVEIRIMH